MDTYSWSGVARHRGNDCRVYPQQKTAKENRKGRTGPYAECCGQHEICERDSLLAAVSKQIEYYDDEELDTFIGRAPEDYTPEEADKFRDVFYTMQDTDVAGWVRSLQLRGISLPDEIKDEVFLVVGERRIHS